MRVPRLRPAIPSLQHTLSRNRIKLSVAAAAILGATWLHTGQGAGDSVPSVTAPPVNDEIRTIMDRMSLEEKVGQMVMAGFPGPLPHPKAATLIRDHHVGGIIYFAHNIENPGQVAHLSQDLQDMAATAGPGIPLLISADQEGGVVLRIRKGVTVFPGNMALGAAGSADHAQTVGRITGAELRAMGINMNLAPSLDVNNNPANPVIGVRSFGEDPELVARLGIATIQGLQGEDVIATAKHFPGHGDTDVDSHIALPTIPHDRERLDTVELLPFREAIAAGVDAMMTAHVTLPAVEPTPGLPATLSHHIVTNLLREELGFEGLIITDAMEMKAITDNFGLGEASVQAVLAGTDMVLMGWPPDWRDAITAIDALTAAATVGIIPAERIDASVARILMLKQKRGILTPEAGNPEQATALTGDSQALTKARQVARDSVTVVKDDAGLLPLSGEAAGRVLVVVPRLAQLTGAEDPQAAASTLGRFVSRRVPAFAEILVDPTPSPSQREQVLTAAAIADTVIIATHRAGDAYAALVQELITLERPLVVVSLREPYDLGGFPSVPVYVAAYGPLPVNVEALVEVLFGEVPARGRLPVTLPNLFPAGHGLQL